jgi:hypothetical protein
MAMVSSLKAHPFRLRLLGVVLATLSYCITEQMWRHKTLYWYDAFAWAAGAAIAAFGNLWVSQLWKKWQERKNLATSA